MVRKKERERDKSTKKAFSLQRENGTPKKPNPKPRVKKPV
jgi:hypothetical protein